MGLIPDRLKMQRITKGLTQNDLAGLAKISIPTITRLENGKTNAKVEDIGRIAAALDTSVAYLLGETDDPSPSLRYYSEILPAGAAAGAVPVRGYGAEILPTGRAGKTGAIPKNQAFESNISEIYYPKGGFIKIPRIDLDVCAGRGWSHDFVDTEIISEELVAVEMVGRIDPERTPFMVIIKGDSMSEADLIDGFNAIINPAEDVHSGDSAMVCYGEDRTVALKRVYFLPEGAIEIRSATPGYPIMKFTHEQQMSEYAPMTIIGRVMGVYGKPKRG
jgi:transcriptional regulator with XRE-family HTH domain